MSLRIPRQIGKTADGKAIVLREDAATQGFGILGKRGRGKSTLAADMIEIFAAERIPFVVFDPPGAHWGIRFAAGADGKPTGPSGLNVLLVGGEHGDVPLDSADPKDLARTIVETNLSCVINLKELSYTALQRYFADFAEELFRLNTTVRHLFFEEAHNIAPQQLKFDEQKRALYATEKLIDDGRGIGLGFTLISQRPAAVNKSVLTQVDNMLVLGMFAPQDIDQVEDWFKHHVKGDKDKLRQITDDIAGMRVGECWMLSPDWKGLMVKFQVRQRVTYHAGRTPKPGERKVNVDRFSVTDAVKKLKTLFAAKQAKRQQEAKDLSEANKEIRALKAELRKKQTAPVMPDHAFRNTGAARPHPSANAEVERRQWREMEKHLGVVHAKQAALKKMLEEAMRVIVKVNAVGFEGTAIKPEEIQKALEATAKEIGRLAKAGLERRNAEFDLVKRESRKLLAHMQRVLADENLNVKVDVRHNEPFSVTAAPRVPRTAAPPPTNGEIRGPLNKILRALSEFEAIGRADGIPRSSVASWCGVKATTGSFKNYLSELRTRGWLRNVDSDRIALTEEGRAVAPPVDAPANTEELLRRAASIFGSTTGKILRLIHEHGGQPVSREWIAEQLGISAATGSFKNYLSELRSAGLIENEGREAVKAAAWMYLET